MTRGWLAGALVVAWVGLPALAQQADGSLAKFKRLTAHADPDFSCSKESGISLTAPVEDAFKAEDDIGVLMGAVVGALNVRCRAAGAPSLLVRGTVNGKEIYRATYRKAGEAWALARVPISSPPSAADAVQQPARSDSAAEQEVANLIRDLELINQCDVLAAHPADPEALAAGVPNGKVTAEARVVCEKAVHIDPQSPRLAFQLARALLALPEKPGEDHEAAALEHLLAAAEQEHGGALAYLGDYYLQGRAGLESNPEAALTLYRRAADAGFRPAVEFLSQIEDVEPEGWFSRQWNAFLGFFGGMAGDYTQEDELRDGIVLDGYHAPKLIEAAVYDNGADAELSYKIARRVSYHMGVSLNNICDAAVPADVLEMYRSQEISVDNMMRNGLAFIINQLVNAAQFVKNPETGLEIEAVQAAMLQAFEEAPFEASEDIAIVVERYGCDGPITQKIAGGLKRMLTYQSPPQSFLSPTYFEKCKASAPRSVGLTYRNEKSDRCNCILTRLEQWPASLAEHKSLLEDFNGTLAKFPPGAGLSLCSTK